MTPRIRRSRRHPAVAAQVQLLEQRMVLAAAFTQFVDPHPADGNQFGATVLPLSTGNVVVTAPFDDAGGTNAGAVYLFNGASGALISTITGSHSNDEIGSGGVTQLANGNFVIASPQWGNGFFFRVGAATWGDGTTGISGTVSNVNSLVGSHFQDDVSSSGITPLTNGNYVVRSATWNNGVYTDVGAVTWGNGAVGTNGIVSPENSLVGSMGLDRVGGEIEAMTQGTLNPGHFFSVTPLTNGNYVVDSPMLTLAFPESGEEIFDAGAVTWGSGTSGVCGVISSANSLVGQQSYDELGVAGVSGLSNGNYIIMSPAWNNGPIQLAGAVTWGDGTIGLTGAISESNSLVGATANDVLGSDDPYPPSGGLVITLVTVLQNGNYVVCNPYWDNGIVADAGAATFVNGETGMTGEITAANSLVGDKSVDSVGNHGAVELTNGNYVVDSTIWGNGSVSHVGAVTLGNGLTGITGVVSASNSLVGSTKNDTVGLFGITPLPNGNYLVKSTIWNNGSALGAGAVTWGNGVSGTVGVISDQNSLVGSNKNDAVGYGGITILPNSNYIVDSYNWANNAGAVTWGSGTSGVSGVVSADNSLVGDVGGEFKELVGYEGVVALANGNYVVPSGWVGSTGSYGGAVTWGSGTSGIQGVISPDNSLVSGKFDGGIGAFIQIGQALYEPGVFALPDGNYVIDSPQWHNAGIPHAGAVTWANGTTGMTGLVGPQNSFVGTTANDQIGLKGIIVLSDGNYVIDSPLWDNAGVADVGAVTWGDASMSIVGTVTSQNSLVGSTAGDQIGSNGITPLLNGGYTVNSPNWDNVDGTNSSGVESEAGVRSLSAVLSPIVNAGAVSFGKGAAGAIGAVTTQNSSVGLTASSGLQTVTLDNVNHTFFTRFLNTNGGVITVGSQVSGFENTAPTAISLINTVLTLPDSTSTTAHIKIADINVTDDALGTNVLSLSGTDAASFELVSSSLYLKAGTRLNALTKPNYSIVVSVKDSTIQNSTAVSAPYSLNIHQDKPPVIGGFTAVISYTENAAPLLLDSAVTISDVDSSNFNGGILTVSLAGNAESTDHLQIRSQGSLPGQIMIVGSTVTFGGVAIGTWSGGTGASPLVVKLNANATPLATQALLRDVTYVDLSENPSIYTRTLTATVTDGPGGTSSTVKKFIRVSAVNDSPRISGISTTALAYHVNGLPLQLTSSVTLSDPDNTSLTTATVQISKNFHPGFDKLTFTNTAKIKGAWDPVAGKLTLTGSDTTVDYQAALEAVTFVNSSNTPSLLTRTISIQVSDGYLVSNVATRLLAVLDTAPTLSAIETSALSYQRANPAVAITSTIIVADSDSLYLTSASIRIVGYRTGDLLQFLNTKKLTGAFNASTGTLTITGSDTVADYIQALRSVRFSVSSSKSATTPRTISMQVNDGLIWSNVASRQIHVN